MIAVSAVVYAVFLLYSAGVEYLLLACIVYAPGTLLFLIGQEGAGAPRVQPARDADLCAAVYRCSRRGRGHLHGSRGHLRCAAECPPQRSARAASARPSGPGTHPTYGGRTL